MPRRRRIHVPGGTYYVLRRTHSPYPIFSQSDDYALLESLLPAVLRRTGASLLAHCWMPNAIHLALQVDAAPIGDFMRELTSHYAQRVHRRTGERGQFFRRPYHATLIDSHAYLPMLVHYLHYVPVLEGLVHDPEDYAHSSHRAYLGRAHQPWVETKPLLQLIDSLDDDRSTYRRLLADAPITDVGTLLERGHAETPGILGDAQFIASLPRRGRVSRSKWSLEQIAAHIARTHDVSRAQLQSRSRRRTLVLARAQMAWYVTERRVASLSEVARYLGHSASSLTRAITRHQRRQPELFTLDAFAALCPLAPPSSNTDSSPVQGRCAWSIGSEEEIAEASARQVHESPDERFVQS